MLNVPNDEETKTSQVKLSHFSSDSRWPIDSPHSLDHSFPFLPDMNLQNEGDPSNLLFVNFNQDAS